MIWEMRLVFIQTCTLSPDFSPESYTSTRELLAKGAPGSFGWRIGNNNNNKTNHRSGLNVTSSNESSKTYQFANAGAVLEGRGPFEEGAGERKQFLEA